MALVLALRALGKDARMVMGDVPPPYLQPFPGVDGVWIAREVDRDVRRGRDHGVQRAWRAPASPASTARRCSTSTTTPATARYGAVNWVDESAAACGELVYDLIEALGVPLTADIATHVYLAILTDTGSFHFSHMTPRTFDIAARCVEAGADPEWIARTHYDSNSMARVQLFGTRAVGDAVDPTRPHRAAGDHARRWPRPPAAPTTTPRASSTSRCR